MLLLLVAEKSPARGAVLGLIQEPFFFFCLLCGRRGALLQAEQSRARTSQAAGQGSSALPAFGAGDVFPLTPAQHLLLLHPTSSPEKRTIAGVIFNPCRGPTAPVQHRSSTATSTVAPTQPPPFFAPSAGCDRRADPSSSHVFTISTQTLGSPSSPKPCNSSGSCCWLPLTRGHPSLHKLELIHPPRP